MNALSLIGMVAASLLLILSATCFCEEKGVHPLRENARRFLRFPWFEKLFVSLFVVAMTVVAAIKNNPTNSTPLNLRLDGVLGNPPALALDGFGNGAALERGRFSAIAVTTNGVSLTLNRPVASAAEPVEVTVAGSTNLVAATWEEYTNVVFAAGASTVEVFIPRGLMAAHSVSNVSFFAFIQSGDSDGDGLDDWQERFNLGTDPYDADTDGDGVADGAEVAQGTDPKARDTDGDGYGDAGDPDPRIPTSWDDLNLDGWPDAWADFWFDGAPPALSPYCDEPFLHGFTATSLLAMGYNPLAPTNANYAVSPKAVPATMQAWEIFPAGFSFSRTNGVYGARVSAILDRTVVLGRTHPWQQCFVSSGFGRGGGWTAEDVGLNVASDGFDMSPQALPLAAMDAWRLEFARTNVASVTFTASATGPEPSLSDPLYLLSWSPRIDFDPMFVSNALVSVLASAGRRDLAVRRSGEDGAFLLPFRLDLSDCPLLDPYDTGMNRDFDEPPIPGVPMTTVEGNAFVSGSVYDFRLLAATNACVAELPAVGTNTPQRLYFYELGVSYSDEVSPGPRASKWSPPYPLSSPSLRSAFHEAGACDAGRSATVRIHPDHPDVRLGPGLGAAGLVTELTLAPGEVAVPYFNGVPDWDGRFALSNSVPERWPQVETGEGDEISADNGCGCGGLADELDLFRPRLRIPLGGPVAGESLGFEWLDIAGGSPVDLSAVKLLVAPSVACTTNRQTGAVAVAAPGGRTTLATNAVDGLAIAVFNASGREEGRWEVAVLGTSCTRVRIRHLTVAGNATEDRTFDVDPVLPDGGLQIPEGLRISGVAPDSLVASRDGATGLVRYRAAWHSGADGPGFDTDVHEETRLPDGTVAETVQCEYSRIGSGVNAVRRLTRRHGIDLEGPLDERRWYVEDSLNPLRNGRLRAISSNRRPWAIHDYDGLGRETVRMEQLDGGTFPGADFAPSVSSERLQWNSPARITVTSYEPPAGDSAHANDRDLPRRVRTHVCRRLRDEDWNQWVGDPVLVSEETWTYSRERDADGVPLRRVVHACGLGGAVKTDETVSYPDDYAVPKVLRGRVVSSTDADGRTTATVFARGTWDAGTRSFAPSPSGPHLRLKTVRTFGDAADDTYSVRVEDADRRLPLYEGVFLAAGDVELEWSGHAYDDVDRLRATVHSDGTTETNAYSCCRLLWSRGRDGRTVLRSAETGRDHLYHAEEDVWILDVLTNSLSRASAEPAFRVVRRWSDSFGRETNSTVCVSTAPGTSSRSDEISALLSSSLQEECFYPNMNSAWRMVRDGRGRCENVDVYSGDGVVTTVVDSGPAEEWPCDNGGARHFLQTGRNRYRNGAVETWENDRTIGDGRESCRVTTWDDGGLRIDCEGRPGSGYLDVVVTNSISRYDALGRLATTGTPLGVTSNYYDGASSRLLRSVTVFSDRGRAFMQTGTVTRTVDYLYDEMGERIGSAVDGVTNRTEVGYVLLDGVHWREATRTVVGPATNSVAVMRKRLTGLDDTCRSRTVAVGADGVVTTSTVSFDAADNVETETVESSDGGRTVTRRVCGLVLEEETAEEVVAYSYDANGRVVKVERRRPGEDGFTPVETRSYSPMGDLVRRETYTNDTETVVESFVYDHEGRVTASTNALGNVVLTDYDARGNVVAVDGAAWPVRSEYDREGRRISLRTTRDNGETWDETAWTYDDPTGLCLAKTYADGSTTAYTYAPDGSPARLTHPGGKWNERVHDARGRVTNVVHSAGTPDTAFAHDAYGNVVRAVDTAGNEWRHLYADDGVLTNEVQTTGGHTNAIERLVDGWRRPSGHALSVDGIPRGSIHYAYDGEGRISAIAATNSAGRGFTVAYTNNAGYSQGYALTTADGDVLRRTVGRDPYRRELTRNCTTAFNGTAVASYDYSFDAGGRPVSRNDDVFAYDDRGEVVAATIGTNVFGHVYDSIGNHVRWAGNSATNFYSNNNLNQTIERISLAYGMHGASTTTNAFSWAAAGGLQTDGTWVYEFDAEDRLASVTSAALTNGAVRILNAYDHHHRRISKTVQRYAIATDASASWETRERRDFVYDGWDLILETVTTVEANAATNVVEVEYFWGPDLSNTLQGAGGVGGLLAVSKNGGFYFPVYDNNGNIVKYVDETGIVVASYEYDDFGRTVSSMGAMAEYYRFRFSSKYYEQEAGLYDYGCRFYSPLQMCWLHRDPLDEDDSANLYMFVENGSPYLIDVRGLFKFGRSSCCTSQLKRQIRDVMNRIHEKLGAIVHKPRRDDERKGFYRNISKLYADSQKQLRFTDPVVQPLKTQALFNAVLRELYAATAEGHNPLVECRNPSGDDLQKVNLETLAASDRKLMAIQVYRRELTDGAGSGLWDCAILHELVHLYFGINVINPDDTMLNGRLVQFKKGEAYNHQTMKWKKEATVIGITSVLLGVKCTGYDIKGCNE